MRLCSIIIAVIITIPVLAQTSSDVFSEELVVTASSIVERVDQVPASVTVITREEIERQNAIDLEEVLRSVPGLFLSRSGSAGSQTSLFTRGVNSTQTLVLWNGIEINNPYFSGYDWGQFSTLGVEKVEVVRGPFSSLYGADAVGGVINVLTGANGPGVSADAQIGEYGLLNGRAEATGVWTNVSADLAIEAREDDGFHLNDDFSQFSVVTSARWSPMRSMTISPSARFNDYELGIPFNQAAPSLDRRQDGGELQVAVPLTIVTSSTIWDLAVSRTEHDIDFDDPSGQFGPFWSETDSTTDRISATARFETPVGTIVGGGEIEDASVTAESIFGMNLDGAGRRSTSVFVEDRLSRTVGGGDLEVAAGFRYDDYDQFGSESSPRLSAGWSRGAFRGRVSYGEAFRAPSIGDLHFPFFGNPDLRAEITESWEAGIDWNRSASRLSLTWFRNDIEDLIVFDPALSRLENLGSVLTSGAEFGGSFRSGAFRLDGSWTFLDTEDRATGQELLRRPEHSGSISIGWQQKGISARLGALHAGKRADFEPTFPFGRVTNDSYTVMDLDVRMELSSGIVPYLRLENLLDETYQEVVGFPAPPRRAIVGLRYIR